MLMDFIGKDNGNQLCDSSQNQIGMESLFILGFATGEAEAILEVIDGTLHSGTDFISRIPIGGSPKGAGVSAQILFRVEVKHSAAGRIRAGILTLAFTMVLFRSFVRNPFHPWANEFISGDAAF